MSAPATRAEQEAYLADWAANIARQELELIQAKAEYQFCLQQCLADWAKEAT